MTQYVRTAVHAATLLVNKVQERRATPADFSALDLALNVVRKLVSHRQAALVQLERVNARTPPEELHRALARVTAACSRGVE